MTLVQLSYIVAVDNYKSFGKAAIKEFVTQPTLSMQVQKLEEELGVKIFDRTKQPVEATPAGGLIIDQARKVLAEAGRIREIIDEETGEMKGPFRVGIIPTIAPYLIPLFLGAFAQKYPEVELIIDETQTDMIVEKLRRDELDAGIAATPLGAPGIAEDPVYYEPFLAYVSQNHKLYGKEEIRSEDIDAAGLWLLKEGHCFREQALQICRTHKSEPGHKYSGLNLEAGSLETLMRLVELNYGMTLIPWLLARELQNTKREKLVKRVTHPVPKREISLVYKQSYLKRRLLKLLKEEIKNAVPKELHDKGNDLILDESLFKKRRGSE